MSRERVKLYTGKKRADGDGGLVLGLFFFLVNFPPALYYLNAWNRPKQKQKRLHLHQAAPPTISAIPKRERTTKDCFFSSRKVVSS